MGEREGARSGQACESACTTSMVSAPDRYRPLEVELRRDGRGLLGAMGIVSAMMEVVWTPGSSFDAGFGAGECTREAFKKAGNVMILREIMAPAWPKRIPAGKCRARARCHGVPAS